MSATIFDRRRMGVLLHPSSLPGPHGIGDVGPEARRFVDWLASAGVTVWQTLPICPPGGPRHDVPYASSATMAGNPQLISLEGLVEDGLLDPADGQLGEAFEDGWAWVERAVPAKEARIQRAVDRLLAGHDLRDEFDHFRAQSTWAEEAARFLARKAASDLKPWWEWPQALRSRATAELRRTDAELSRAIDGVVARLFLFERQWSALRAYANALGVALLGDLPIYINHDSVDVWANPEGWRLDADGHPTAVAGVPPDYFSEDGQLWGAPLYDWDRMAEDDYHWWRRRLARAFEHFDCVRIDHFRAFSAFWEVPQGAKTARGGKWVKGPGQHFFDTVRRHMGPVDLCAEDLGTIDDDVRDLLAAIDVPGMKILQFAFGDGPDNLYLPHNVSERSIMYPGNHDNDTTVVWWQTAPEHVRAHVQHYLGVHGDNIAWDLNRVALASTAQLAVLQMQDILSLESWARMNDPSSYVKPVEELTNWRWRMKPGEANGEAADRLRFLGHLYGRIMT